MINRYFDNLESYLEKNKVLIIYGPRRVGKTTLVKNFLKTTSLRYKIDSGDNVKVQHIISSGDFDLLKDYCHGYDLLVIDEAQSIPHVGKGLKIIVDEVPNIKVIVTGSSSFDLSNKVGEPLVGRQRIIRLFPLALLELAKELNKAELKEKLPDYLIYGLYPEVITSQNKNAKVEYLSELVHSFLLKDILALENIKSSRILMDLLRLLAYQIGSEVSLNELSSSLKIDVKTVGRYLDLLEKTFIIISVGGFSRNLRSEVVSKKKYFFVDVGIRNGIINAFNPLITRNDIGPLWENFLFIERLKKKLYKKIYSNDYFWRTYAKSEIDLVEERDGSIFPFEFKWKDKSYKTPNEWSLNYPGTSVEVVNSENFLNFIM